jgi:predicted  nucleic acid-binding Zn-ribbon protein
MFLEERLDNLDRKISSIEEKIDFLCEKISSMQSLQPQALDENQLKNSFDSFRDNWNSGSPELESLKGTLSTLRSALSNLNSSLVAQEDDSQK